MAETKARDEATFLEAIRSMPALVLAKTEGRHDDAKMLLSAIAQTGKASGLAGCEIERAKFHAAYWWFQETLMAMASDRDQTLQEVVQSYSQVAAEFVARNE